MERDDDDDDIPTPDTSHDDEIDLSSPIIQTNPTEALPPGLCACKLI
jgi:hypothetical protein